MLRGALAGLGLGLLAITVGYGLSLRGEQGAAREDVLPIAQGAAVASLLWSIDRLILRRTSSRATV